ncbi:MAG: serine--tRNA ligase [Phycisphaerales bacterium]|jgi:seryl-tRNA synthetase|nr:serine--tRNA ligase [Phycisphaerales bacterium]
MIDLKALRDDPERFIQGARDKGIDVDIPRLIELDARRREALTRQESARAEQKRISREVGPQIGKLKGQLKQADGGSRAALESQIAELEARPAALKRVLQQAEADVAEIDGPFRDLLLHAPLPADDDVPRGESAEDNVELRRWSPDGFDPDRTFESQAGFRPRTHLELVESLGLVDFKRAVKVGGTRHYSLAGDGFRLHEAILQFALDVITREHGFTPMSVPVIVREDCMIGTGFFPEGRPQAYQVDESSRGAGQDLYLTGTGEVGLMGLHADEILEAQGLPIRLATRSTCFRREAGAAGRDTAGLYRIHQFDKVEQVVICKADADEERTHHADMIATVESILQRLELPYRLLQCCTGDLGPKNADMIDIECWMPGRGELDANGIPLGDWGETHSASRLHDYQCRRLNLRYRDGEKGTTFCWSLNNTVIASPRILVPLLEMHQQADGSIAIPEVLQPYLGGCASISG